MVHTGRINTVVSWCSTATLKGKGMFLIIRSLLLLYTIWKKYSIRWQAITFVTECMSVTTVLPCDIRCSNRRMFSSSATVEAANVCAVVETCKLPYVAMETLEGGVGVIVAVASVVVVGAIMNL